MTIFQFGTLFLVLVLAGCGKAPEQAVAEKKMEGSSGVETKLEPQENDLTTAGEAEMGKYTVSSGEDAEIPKDFPADVYIYSPSSVMTAMDMPEGGALGLTTADDAPTVAAAYTREMTARSWSKQSAEKDGERLMLVYEKEGRMANIIIGSVDDAAQILVTVTKK